MEEHLRALIDAVSARGPERVAAEWPELALAYDNAVLYLERIAIEAAGLGKYEL